MTVGDDAMYTFTVWTFPTPAGADDAERILRSRDEPWLIAVEDAALISWPETFRKPTMRDIGSLEGPGALWAGFWGLLLGLIFLAPLSGLAFGAAAGVVAGSLADIGIDDAFVRGIRADVTPGTSALFVLSHYAAIEPLTAALKDLDPRLLRANLTADEEERLRAVFAEEGARTERV